MSEDIWLAADPMLAEMGTLSAKDPRRIELRERVICRYVGEARREASRYRNTGEPFEDLVQVATLGLILAVDRYDPRRGIRFKHFAVPTIVGELKRHFRDRGWGVKVTRRVQELCQEVRRAEPFLAQRLGRTPSTADLAEHLNLSDEDIQAARVGAAAYTSRSLNYPKFAVGFAGGDDDTGELSDHIGGLDPDLEAVPDHDALMRAWPLLPDRLRVILVLRFVEELSQSHIAENMGISQMHVSRLIARSLTILRRSMADETRWGANGKQRQRGGQAAWERRPITPRGHRG